MSYIRQALISSLLEQLFRPNPNTSPIRPLHSFHLMAVIDDTEPRSGPRDTSWPPMVPIEVAVCSDSLDTVPTGRFVKLKEFNEKILFVSKHEPDKILLLKRSLLQDK